LWFTPLSEKDSLLLEDLDNFLTKFNDTFGKTDRIRTTITKIHSLYQGSRPTSVYTADFRQLACDVDWDDNVLRWVLYNDVKDLLLNLLDSLTLTKAITQEVRCNNRLFERQQE
jgi:hypothetical protein